MNLTPYTLHLIPYTLLAMQDTRIAVVISNAPLGHTAENLSQIAHWVEQAGDKTASLVCFPEMQATGYHIDPVIKETAEPVPGPAVRHLEHLASKHNLTILAGIAEIEANDAIYATHLVVRPEGWAGKYRKLHLGPPEQAVYTAGDGVPVFEADGLCFGLQLCYDAHFPELSTTMALKGADAIFIPHASPGEDPDKKLASWMRHLPARAFDNGLFVIACNQTGDNGHGLSFPGVGMVIAPSGMVIDSYAGMDGHMMVVDLKADELSDVRGNRMRYFLPNRRPDIYHV